MGFLFHCSNFLLRCVEGCSIQADMAFRYLTKDSAHEVVAFAVNRGLKNPKKFHGLPVVEFETV